MGANKLANERKLMWVFTSICAVILILSIVFLIQSINRAELGGSFLSAMLLFISGYGLVIFIARQVRYGFLTKLIKSVNEDNVTNISSLAETLSTNEKKIEKELNFAINNGFLPGKEIINNELVDELHEQIHMDMQRIRRVKTSTPKKEKKTVISEKCPNCGAKVRFEDGVAECPYCGNSLKKA